jgi:hypothetical protein
MVVVFAVVCRIPGAPPQVDPTFGRDGVGTRIQEVLVLALVIWVVLPKSRITVWTM